MVQFQHHAVLFTCQARSRNWFMTMVLDWTRKEWFRRYGVNFS